MENGHRGQACPVHAGSQGSVQSWAGRHSSTCIQGPSAALLPQLCLRAEAGLGAERCEEQSLFCQRAREEEEN